MTSLLPLQYVTPITTSASSVAELSNTEQHQHWYQHQQHHFQQKWYNNTTRMPLNTALTTVSSSLVSSSLSVEGAKSKPTTPNTNSNNRLAYVDALVDVNALVIELIWQLNPAIASGNSSSNSSNHNNCRNSSSSKPSSNSSTSSSNSSNKSATKNNVVVPLRTFIQEVLKRSRTTYSTLQTALFYLFRSRPEINSYLTRMQQQQQQQNNNNNNNNWEYAYINCGRRMFLASLVVASKFVQDKTYRNSAWAKIAGLPVSEVNAAERIFLNLIDYRLYISQPKFEQWHHLLHMHVEAKTLNQPTNIQDLSTLPFAAANIDFYEHEHNNQFLPSPRTTPPRPQQNYGWTLVLSPTTFLPPPLPVNATNSCECQSKGRLSKKRKTSTSSYPPPVLSMSLPSSISSSPMQTPTQISPVRMNNGTSVFNWNSPTSFDHNILHQRSVMNTSISSGNNNHNSKKRKFSIVDNHHSRSYNISNVRQQQSNRFHL